MSEQQGLKHQVKEVISRKAVKYGLPAILVLAGVHGGLNLARTDEATVLVKKLAYSPLLNGITLLDNGTDMQTIEKQYGAYIKEIADAYGIPVGGIKGQIYVEYYKKGKYPFGVNPTLAQDVKAMVNYASSVYLGQEGDTTEKGIHIGPSFGPLNQKPGIFTLPIILGIQDSELRHAMLTDYDIENGHVKDAILAELVTDNLPNAVELAAAHMYQWKEAIEKANSARDPQHQWTTLEINNLYRLTCCSFPADREYLYKLVGESLAPHLDDVSFRQKNPDLDIYDLSVAERALVEKILTPPFVQK